MKSHSPARRAFLKRSGQLAMTGTALPFALNLAAIGEAAAFNSSDYKALVCVFLFGGNDYANTVVTYDDPSYNEYCRIRGGDVPTQSAGGIALSKASLAATLLNPTVPLPGGRQYALHPSMTGLADLFNSGSAAVQLNVGPLVVPLTRQQYNNANRTLYPVPPKLFSHNDQQSTWQSSRPEGSTVGWGGNLGDMAPPPINSKSTFTCISASGNAVYLSGDTAVQYQVNPYGTAGAVPIAGVKSNIFGSSVAKDKFTQLIKASRSHILENEYNIVTGRAISAEGDITNALTAYPATAAPFTNWFAPSPAINSNSLALQLKLVSRLIAGRSMLGSPRRQVFFVSMGGFDLHDNLIAQQPVLLQRVSEAMTAFHKTMNDLGIADKVTAFTASDFGRTLTSNGDGSDHGWGSHHFVVGGAVRGKAFYGTAPTVSNEDNLAIPANLSHVGQGRLLPTTSVDQYAATMAKWFGVTDAEMPSVLPNINHFGTAAGRPDYPTDMGFML